MLIFIYSAATTFFIVLTSLRKKNVSTYLLLLEKSCGLWDVAFNIMQCIQRNFTLLFPLQTGESWQLSKYILMLGCSIIHRYGMAAKCQPLTLDNFPQLNMYNYQWPVVCSWVNPFSSLWLPSHTLSPLSVSSSSRKRLSHVCVQGQAQWSSRLGCLGSTAIQILL